MAQGTAPELAVQSGKYGSMGELLVSKKQDKKQDKKPQQQTLSEFAQAIYKKGFETADKGEFDKAIGILENVNSALPILTAAQLQAGRCHWEMHRWEMARKCFETAVRLEPHNNDAAWTVGLLALQMGDFKTGWANYERRWGSKTFESPRLHTKHPQWERGKGLKKPLVWCEQGIGDQLLYASLIEALAKEVDEVTVMIDMRLANLLQRGCKATNVKFLSHNARVKMGDHDSHIPIASLGKYFINSARDLPTHISQGYVKADPERVARLRKEYGLEIDDMVVGLCWTSTAPIIGAHKSVPLAAMKPILDIPGIKFINLQYGDVQDEGVDFHPSLITTHIDTFFDLENVAALMNLCHFVVSPSCATVHLAGAMGVPVLLLDANKLWYWNNRVGNQSLWYPSVRMYQRENMNAPWDLQIQQIKAELEDQMCIHPTMKDNPVFVFFHVGEDISYPQKMVKSVLRYNPDAHIIMCTDTDTPDVMGVTDRFETEIDRERLMYSRVKAYARLGYDGSALYLDTDMIVQGDIDVEGLLGDKDIALCRRTFNNDMHINPKQRIDLSEYEGRNMGELYPYVGCAVATRDGKPWQELLRLYESLDPKFKKWYGDQEVLRYYAEMNPIAEFPESIYGCLPEHRTDEAKILHFKGPARKQLFEVA